MTIKPEDIVNKKFSFSFRGYNPDEVDAFLDEVVEEMEYLQAEIERLTSRQALVEEQQTAIGSMESALRETLALAQKTAGEIVQAAQDKADALTDRAQDKAERLVEDGRNRARRILDEAAQRKRMLTAQADALARQIAEMRERYRAELEAQLRLIGQEGMPGVVVRVPERDLAVRQALDLVAKERDELPGEVAFGQREGIAGGWRENAPEIERPQRDQRQHGN